MRKSTRAAAISQQVSVETDQARPYHVAMSRKQVHLDCRREGHFRIDVPQNSCQYQTFERSAPKCYRHAKAGRRLASGRPR